MGVPAFFKWLSMKYPSIVSHCVEKRGMIIDDEGTRAKVDTTEPNPNGEEFDNLYLDMNGIIHPCTHPENKPAPKNEAEMFVAIFEYIDRLMALVRPRRILYMAVDGVAPRAKMNQQRSRRFRAAQESSEKLLSIKRLREELEAKGAHLPPSKPASEHFDSNCITPGTPFMARLAIALQYYIYERLNNDPGWKNLIVFLSDANAPGEGEHKIMDFIRRQRSSPTHDPNTRHCLCGADADLIMLGLATHEPYFTIIREEFKPNQPKPCDLCGQLGHDMEDCVGTPREDEQFDGPPPMPGSEVDFIFIRLNVLREYLEQDLKLPGIDFEWDLERVIDDWVFMCFFVGNDFLPHLPSLEIREGAIDRLIEIYKHTVQQTGGWLTDSGQVNMKRVQLILTDLGKAEDEIFKNRRSSELNFRERKRRQNQGGSGPQRFNQQPRWTPPSAPTSGLLQPIALGTKSYGVAHPEGRYYGSNVTAQEVQSARRTPSDNVSWVDQNLNNLEVAATMKAMLKPRQPPLGKRRHSNYDAEKSAVNPPMVDRFDEIKKGCIGGVGAAVIMKKPAKGEGEEFDEDERTDAADEVRLWEDGWRSRYYQSKFGVDPSDAPEFCLQVAHEYARGLCWVLAYYYQGCVSWDWYFPYHYAPFASDFVDVAGLDPGFHKVTTPFRPLEQLMGVFPADSRSHVPPAWQDLMTDPDSAIIDFYPTDFKVDLNGKRFLWMGVALLPFVDEVRLLKALDERRHLLTEEEFARNVRGPDRLFCHVEHSVGAFLEALYGTTCDGKSKKDGAHSELVVPNDHSVIDPKLTSGVSGRIWPDHDVAYLPGQQVPSGVPSLLPDLPVSNAVSVCFADPHYPKDFIFQARLLESVKMPPRTNLLPPQRGRGRGRGGGFRGPRGHSMHEGSHRGAPAAERMMRHYLSTDNHSHVSSNDNYPTGPQSWNRGRMYRGPSAPVSHLHSSRYNGDRTHFRPHVPPSNHRGAFPSESRYTHPRTRYPTPQWDQMPPYRRWY